jgi:hypothetical protein
MSTNSNLISVGSTTPISEQTFYSSTPPTSTAGYSAGDTYYVTPLGTQADSANATEEWRYDGTKWVKTPSGESTPTVQNVYVDTADVNDATIFSLNPDLSDPDPALAQNSQYTYIGIDGADYTWNGTEYITKVYNFPTHQPVATFTATAGQTVFTLPKVPIGAIWGRRNSAGRQLSFTNVGTTVTYNPANNGGMTMDAGDIVEITFEAY